MKILVDADSCPVKSLIIKIAAEYAVDVYLVASFNHQLLNYPEVKTIQVDAETQAVDLEIVRLAESGDIVITQDYGLAAIILAKKARVISPRGKIYSEQNIDYLLEHRHLMIRYRRGNKRVKGPSSFNIKDRKRFEITLRWLLDEQGENNERI